MFVKINIIAYIARKSINSQNIFIRKKRQNDDANSARKFIKRLTFNVLKDKRRKKESKLQRR